MKMIQKLLTKVSIEIINKICISKCVRNPNLVLNYGITGPEEAFKNSFKIFPTKYLPPKKRKKIEATGKPKRPSVLTSDSYHNYITEDERKKEIKDERVQNKNELAAKKKNLNQNKQNLFEKIKMIREKLKIETSPDVKKNLIQEKKILEDQKLEIEIKIKNIQKEINAINLQLKLEE